MRVVATTPILADLAQQIAGERASVHSLVPAGADPHSYEPSLRDIRDVAYARCALTNGLLLEQRKLSKMVEANLPAGVVSVAVAEKIEQYGGKLEAIVEDASLDSIWLGLRVEEGGQNESAPADSSDAGMRFEVQSVRARTSTDSSNAQLAAFITQTFGAVEMLCDSHARGVNLTREGDTAIRTGDMGSLELPLQAHTHLSWAFSDAGEYAIELSATAVKARSRCVLRAAPCTARSVVTRNSWWTVWRKNRTFLPPRSRFFPQVTPILRHAPATAGSCFARIPPRAP